MRPASINCGDTAERLDREVRNAREQVRERGDRLSRTLQTRAETGLREVREAVETLRDRLSAEVESRLEESSLPERARRWQREANERWSEGLERVLGALPVASRREVEQMNRKLNRLQRKLRNLEKAQSA